MRLQPPIYTLTDTPFPYTTRFRSVVACSASPWLTGLALMAAGGAWMVSVTIFNIGVQTMSPRWVAGRVLAAFQTAVAGGLAIGSRHSGHAAEHWGVGEASTVQPGAASHGVLVGRVPKTAVFSMYA